MRKIYLLLFLCCGFLIDANAQSKTISGTVTDADNLPLPGVNIVVKGTTIGTVTDIDGNYTLSVPEGTEEVVFSYIGYAPQTRPLGTGPLNLSFVESAVGLDEVVVTGLGIKREKKALGYSVDSVNEDEIAQRAEGDIARLLSGKASGVQVTSAGGASGSATNITVRGLSSFSGSNQALFIVDGIPFSNDTNGGVNGGNGNFVDGATAGSRFLDLDPNNIESIEILKGLTAATLYGCLLYTSPSPRDGLLSRMPSSA